jgi:hypothetical protein
MAQPGSIGTSDGHPADRWIDEWALGRSFADVGGLWNIVNEKITMAARAGATELTMIDVTPPGNELWQRFDERCAAAAVTCVSIPADVNEVAARAGQAPFDVVHCSGLLYHSPDPMRVLVSLARLTTKVLILGCAITPTWREGTAADAALAPGASLFVPAMSERQRRAVSSHFRAAGATTIVGIDEPCAADPGDYARWWWVFTVECVRSMLEAAGFTVVDSAFYWQDRAVCFLAHAPVARDRQ